MFSEYLLLVLGIPLVSSGLVRIQDAENTLLADAKDPDWWKTASIYQIYPKSFKDTDGDGIGDLPGVIESLDYIKSLGVQAICLSSIFDSPQIDNGYDVSDYKKIWPTFGTMTNFEDLVKKAHEKGLLVIIDFVPNHTSDQHEWFAKSVKQDDWYKDYYVWRNCSKEDGTFDKVPNNWESVFGGSAWTYHKERKQCYLHQFLKEQPDLNYWNSQVIYEMRKITEFWLINKKVDGMRVNAVPYIFEDKSYEDEPYNKDDKTLGLNHTKTMNQQETFELFNQFISYVQLSSAVDNITRIVFTEATDLRYYGDIQRIGAHFTLNSRFLGLTEQSTAKDIGDIIRNYTKELDNIYPFFVPNWMLGNHDTHRIASKVGIEKVDGLNMLTAFLPGIQVTYQGEELGMTNGKVNCEKDGVDFKDDCKIYPHKTRDYERTPFQWSSADNAGFTKGKPWLPIAEDYETVNVDEEKKKPTSHLNVYIASQTLRSYIKGNASGIVQVLNKGNEKLLHLRRGTYWENNNYNNNDMVFDFFFNMDDKQLNITLEAKEHIEILASNKPEKKLSDPSSHVVELEGYESVVVAYKLVTSGAPALAFSYVLFVVLGILTTF